MKKNLLYLFALICSVSLFTACSDDDDNTWKQIPTEGVSTPNATLNGKPSTGTAMLKVSSADKGVVNLKDIIYGVDDVNVDVTMKKTANDKYTFEGQKDITDAGLVVKVTGDVTLTEEDVKTRAVVAGAKVNVAVTIEGYGALSDIYKKDSLEVTVNGTAQSNNLPVTLKATSDSKMTLNFNKIVNVAADVNVEATYTKESAGYAITGSTQYKEGYIINVTGTLSTEGKLSLVVTTNGYASISKSFYASKNAPIKYNGVEVTSGTISINASSETEATIKVAGFVPGGVTISIEKATLKETNGVYTVNGSAKTADYEIQFVGTITQEKTLTDAEVTYKSLLPIVGKWAVKMGNQGAESIFKFVSQKGAITFPQEIISMLPDEMKPIFAGEIADQQVVTAIKGLLGQYVQQLNSIEFTAGGDVVISYTDLGATKPSELNILKYCVREDGKVYLIIDIMSLMSGGFMAETSPVTRAWDPGTILTDGIPLNFEVKSGVLNIWLDREVTVGTVKFAKGLLPMFGELLGDKAEMVISLVDAVDGILTESTDFEAGLIMEKK